MAKSQRSKKKTAQYKIISLRKLSDESKVEYAKIYNNLIGRYGSLNANDKTAICNTLVEEMEPMFDFLGFEMIITRKFDEAVINGSIVRSAKSK